MIVAATQVGRFGTGGASNIGWGRSTNGGTTWTHGFLPGLTVYSTPVGPYARASDPAVAYDAKHNIWLITRSVSPAARTTSWARQQS